MKEIFKGKKPIWPDKPDDVVATSICTVSGQLSDPAHPCPTRFEYFWSGTQPTTLDTGFPRDVSIVPTTGLPFKDGDPVDGQVTQQHVLLSDPFTQNFCVDCTRPVDDKGHITYPDSYTIPIFQPKLTQ